MITKKILTSISVVITLVCFFGVYFFYTSTTQDVGEEKISLANLQEVVTEDSINTRFDTGEAFTDFKGEETGTKYKYLRESLPVMKAEIEKAEATDSESEVLYKRAIYYMRLASVGIISDDSDPEKNKMIIDAYNGLFENLFKIGAVAKDENRNPRYLRRLYVYVISYIYNRSNNPDLFMISYFTQDKDLLNLLEKHALNKDIASILYIDSLFSIGDLQRDNFMVSEKLNNLSRLLYYPEVTEDIALKSKILEEAQKLILAFPTAVETQLTSSPEENRSRPQANYATALGVLSRFTPTVTTAQAKIAFSEAYKALRENLRSKEDNLLSVKFMLDVNYASLLFNENNKKLNSEIVAVLADIENYRASIEGNTELTNVFNNYLRGVQRESAIKDGAKMDLLLIASQNEAFKSLLVAAGVELQ
ncbi:MAG: hypothetical protein WAX38_00365 [Minisyncoccia bacterium]